MRDRTEKLSFLLLLAISLLFFVPLMFRSCSATAFEPWQEEAAAAFIRDHLKSYQKRREAALELLPALFDAARAGKFDPLTLAVHVALESSWRPEVTGAKGEVGLTQVLPKGVCGSGYDLTDPAQQLLAGALCLSRCYESCGESDDGYSDERMERAITKYVTGACTTKSERVRKQMKYRVKLINAAQKKYIPQE